MKFGYDHDVLLLEADFVTTEQGTGFVHIAPGHGLDDYLTGLEHDLEIYCPLDDYGCYSADDYMPDELVGLSVLEKSNGCAANHKVIEILEKKNLLLAQKKHHHQYLDSSRLDVSHNRYQKRAIL